MTAVPAMSVVWRLAAATTLIVLAFAMAAPVLAVSLQQAGHSTAAIGAFAMIPFLPYQAPVRMAVDNHNRHLFSNSRCTFAP